MRLVRKSISRCKIIIRKSEGRKKNYILIMEKFWINFGSQVNVEGEIFQSKKVI